MPDRTLRGAACLSFRWMPVWAMLLAGCGAVEPDGAAKRRRDLDAPAAAASTLDGLPLLRLNTDPGINLDEYTPSDISVAGRRYTATQAKYRGASSSKFPKKSFTLKFAKGDALDDERTGFTDARKVVLISSFDDSSYVRHGLALQLWNRMDPEHLQVRTAFVSVLLNEEYEGVYLMADHVGEHLMERHGLWEDGNLYQARSHLANLANDGSPHSGFTKEEGKPEEGKEGAFADLEALVGWLAEADDDELKNDLGAHLDVGDYIDWWILVNLIDASDSTAKNSFHYHDPRAAEPPNVFRCLPWDFNASFGQDWRTRLRRSTGALDRYDGSNEVFARLTGSDHFAPELRERFRTLLQEELSLTWVQAWLDDTRAQIEEAALQDEACWSDAYRYTFESYRGDVTDYAAESAHVDEWISERWGFVSEQLAVPGEP